VVPVGRPVSWNPTISSLPSPPRRKSASVRVGGTSGTLRRAVNIPRQSPSTQTSRIDVSGVNAEML
jgi:hypothetical protein